MYSSFNIHIGSWFKCKSIFRGFQFSTSYLFCFLQPLGQYWFQFACILEAQLQVFKPANSSLAEFRAMHCSQCFSNVSLRVTCKKWRKKKLLSIRCLAFTAEFMSCVCLQCLQDGLSAEVFVTKSELTSEKTSASCWFHWRFSLI